MNEQFTKLAIQATGKGFETFATSDFDSQEKIQKFAELIVRECIKQCNVNFVGTVGSHPNAHNRGVKMCIDNIKEHFGVEE